MGYHIEMGLVVTDKIAVEAYKNAKIKRLLEYADSHVEEDDLHLFYWCCVKWTSDVDELSAFLSDQEYDDYYFMSLGEDYGDKDEEGGFWDNPFELRWHHGLEFYGDDVDNTSVSTSQEVLKVKNSSPEATKCASCGGKLKEPYPGIKLCPKCE
jgi:hypothetical protein